MRLVVTVTAGAVLSLIATIGAAVVFVMMLSESVAVSRGRDPVTNRVRSFIRRYPRITYMAAVLIGLLLGHFFWT
jgi:hypothetical protein